MMLYSTRLCTLKYHLCRLATLRCDGSSLGKRFCARSPIGCFQTGHALSNSDDPSGNRWPCHWGDPNIADRFNTCLNLLSASVASGLLRHNAFGQANQTVELRLCSS